MNTFAFNPRDRFEKQYSYILQKIKKNDQIWDFFKVWWLAFLLLFFILSYLYFVNLASTRGYFLRQAMQKYTSISFQQEIVKTDILKIKQANWEKMKTMSLEWWAKKIIKAEVVSIPSTWDNLVNY